MKRLVLIGITLTLGGFANAVTATKNAVSTAPEAPAEATSQQQGVIEVKAEASEDAAPVYVPPRRGAPKTRVGGGTRSGGDDIQVALLAPEHTGLTGQAAPSLFWWLSAPHEGPFEYVLTDRQSVEPLLRFRQEGPLEAGVHRIDLAAHGVTLEPGVVYQWSVAIVRDERRRSHDVVSVATLERVSGAAAAESERALAAAGVQAGAGALAQAGLWYDAIDLVSATDGRPARNAALLRAELLDQVALDPVARWDRSGS